MLNDCQFSRDVERQSVMQRHPQPTTCRAKASALVRASTRQCFVILAD
jgi:hypothetical protein